MKVGDRVVCVQGHYDPKCNLVKGREYIIYATRKCPCGGIGFDVGIIGTSRIGNCLICSSDFIKDVGVWIVSSTRFRPIQYNSAHDELIESIVEEKADVEVKETVS